MKTDDFEIGARVRIHVATGAGHFMNGMTGTVVDRDAYTVEVRLDTITPSMMNFEDTRKGLANFEPEDLILLYPKPKTHEP